MTETQLRKVPQVFNGKDVGPLIFDEEPYKAYTVKLQSPIQLKYICFDKYDLPTKSLYDFSAKDDGTGKVVQERIYKGEGTINFIAYKPYAEARYHYLDDFEIHKDDNIINAIAVKNMKEWEESSHLLQNAEAYDAIWSNLIEPNGEYNLWAIYNPGDIEMGFKMYIPKDQIISNPSFKIEEFLTDTSTPSSDQRIAALSLDFSKVLDRLDADNGTLICINTTNELIEGSTSAHDLTGFLYNDAIKSGDLIKIPATDSASATHIRYLPMILITVATTVPSALQNIKIDRVERHYLYY